MSIPVIQRIKKTCGGCPAQWEGITSDGEWFYFRYRWGTLRVGRGENRHWDSFFMQPYGSPHSGTLAYDELRALLSGVVELPLIEDNSLEVPR